MGGFILPRGCKCSQIVPHGISLDSTGQANHQQGRITFPTGVINNVVSIIPHQGYLPIVGLGGIPMAQLRLTVDTVSLNNVVKPAGLPYSLSVPVTLDFGLQPARHYDWPTDIVPLWSSPEPRQIGMHWDYEWIQPNGQPYAVATPWVIEFYLLEKCITCN
jgi:hypothetical protein